MENLRILLVVIDKLLAVCWWNNREINKHLLFLMKDVLNFSWKSYWIKRSILKGSFIFWGLTSALMKGNCSSLIQAWKTFKKVRNQFMLYNFRWVYAWRICEHTKIHEHWNKFAIAVTKNGEVDLGCFFGRRGKDLGFNDFHMELKFRKNKMQEFSAIRIFKQINAVGVIWSLEEMQYIEEKTLLNGYLALLLGDFDAAEEFFLQSSNPREALDVRYSFLLVISFVLIMEIVF